jgi:hypothetical protein
MIGDAACFGCGVRFELELLEAVGDTVFCRGCLGQMLRRVDERTRRSDGDLLNGASGVSESSRVRDPGVNGRGHAIAAGAGSIVERAPTPRVSAADAPCFVCGEPLEGRALVVLRGLAICARCSPDLIGDDSPAGDDASPGHTPSWHAVPSQGEGRAVANDTLGDDSPTAPRGLPIPTPGSGTEWCSRCRRAMPGPGSYVLVDGRPHCAACAAARTQRPGAASVAPAAIMSDDQAAPEAGACDACCRVLGGREPEIEGFRLCAACQSSDLELALEVARTRHQRLLARTGRRLLDGDDD